MLYGVLIFVVAAAVGFIIYIGRPYPPRQPEQELLTVESEVILDIYNALEDDAKVFPELRDTLKILDEKAKVSGGTTASRSNPSQQEIKHAYGCQFYNPWAGGRTYVTKTMRWYGKRNEFGCVGCMEHLDVLAAVVEIYSAQEDRKKRIKDANRALEIKEIDSRLASLSSLTESMRNEAKIIKSVTDQVYPKE